MLEAVVRRKCVVLILFVLLYITYLFPNFADSLTLSIGVRESVESRIKSSLIENNGLVEFRVYFENLGSLTCNVESMVEICNHTSCTRSWSYRQEVLPANIGTLVLRSFLDEGNYSYRLVVDYCAERYEEEGNISIDDVSTGSMELLEKVKAFVEDNNMILIVKLRDFEPERSSKFCVLPVPSPNIVLSSACGKINNKVVFKLYFDAPIHLQSDRLRFIFILLDGEGLRFESRDVEFIRVDSFVEKLFLHLRLRLNLI